MRLPTSGTVVKSTVGTQTYFGQRVIDVPAGTIGYIKTIHITSATTEKFIPSENARRYGGANKHGYLCQMVVDGKKRSVLYSHNELTIDVTKDDVIKANVPTSINMDNLEFLTMGK